MPELKNVFHAGKMNKDLDERLVNEGDYRDANNIEITTSEGSNAGVVQTLKGNTKHSTIASIDNITGVYDIPNTASGTCVACVSAPDENKITKIKKHKKTIDSERKIIIIYTILITIT